MPRHRSRNQLGERLREYRESCGWSLREVAAKAGVNHGYLSQLERGDVAEPAPSMLHKIAAGYDVPFSALMQWAGYIEETEGALTPNQAIALSYFGDDVSDDELDAVRAVIDVLRSRRSPFGVESESLDGHLSPEDRKEIRANVLMLLRRADAVGVFPTPLEDVMSVSKLVAAGEITLDDDEKRQLRKRFGTLVDKVLNQLMGVIHRGTREVWVQPELPTLRRRFVTAHEIGHDALPWQRELAYLDDDKRLRDDVRIRYEREANQAAIELLAQGDTLRREADDSRLTMSIVSTLSNKYQISLQATARRITEETRKDAALAIRFRGRSGAIGPYHVYCSPTFQARFGWAVVPLPADAKLAAREASRAGEAASFYAIDLSATFVEVATETLETPYAFIALFTPVPKGSAVKRFLHVG
ncbi:MAG: helix-turn-helix domain-containing protein [Actinobacteria bacterium]|nr:helix-turn-helix domain-containing protein [Actinomycetota bacterium]